MDTCSGENKNKMVIQLAVYLLEMYNFEEVQFAFLVTGHTKNCADQLFNLAKSRYNIHNIFMMGQLWEAVKHELVVPHMIEWTNFKNWDKLFKILYKVSLNAVNKYQIFRCDGEDLDDGDLECKMSDLENAKTSVNKLKNKLMGALDRVEKLLNLKPEPLYTEKPGLKPIKECKFFFKYWPHVPEEHNNECCPRPSGEVLQTEADQKKEKTAKYMKEKSAKLKEQDTAAVDNSSNDRQELTTAGSESETLTSPTSPSKRTRDDDKTEAL
jgi:hypothetical protein